MRNDGVNGAGEVYGRTTQERLRHDDVHGDSQGLRVLRGHTGLDQIVGQPPRRRWSRRHCFPRRPSPMGSSPVSLAAPIILFFFLTYMFFFFSFFSSWGWVFTTFAFNENHCLRPKTFRREWPDQIDYGVKNEDSAEVWTPDLTK